MFVFLEDQAESMHLASNFLSEQDYQTQLLFRNVRSEFCYSARETFRFFHYLTKHNTTIPFAVETNEGVLGYLPLENPIPTHAEQMAAQSFLKNYRNAKVVMIHRQAELAKISQNTLLLSDLYFY